MYDVFCNGELGTADFSEIMSCVGILTSARNLWSKNTSTLRWPILVVELLLKLYSHNWISSLVKVGQAMQLTPKWNDVCKYSCPNSVEDTLLVLVRSGPTYTRYSSYLTSLTRAIF